ncbi:MAG: MFS transporter [Novosphingobium sp.]
MAMAPAAGVDDNAPNHPNAKWMGGIGWLAHNMAVGTTVGSLGVMAASIAERTGMERETALLGGPLVMLGAALAAPVAGALIARTSLRLCMSAGAAAALIGFALLVFAPSTYTYFGACFLLFGPAMAVTGSIGPATLVTRWFGKNRGLALGLVHVNLLAAALPMACAMVLKSFDAQTVYIVLAGLVAFLLIPATLGARDYPPGAAGSGGDAPAPAAGLTLVEIAARPAFWCLAVASSAIITSIMVLTFGLVTMAEGMGYTREIGAFLQTLMALCGMAGSILFGWLADKLGGFKGLALLALNFAILMGLLLFKLPYPALLVVIALLGLHGAGMVPNVSRALAATLGQESFSRAFGLSSFLSVVFTAAGLYGMNLSMHLLGNYSGSIIGLVALLLIAIPLALMARKWATTPG